MTPEKTVDPRYEVKLMAFRLCQACDGTQRVAAPAAAGDAAGDVTTRRGKTRAAGDDAAGETAPHSVECEQCKNSPVPGHTFELLPLAKLRSTADYSIQLRG